MPDIPDPILQNLRRGLQRIREKAQGHVARGDGPDYVFIRQEADRLLGNVGRLERQG